MTHPTFTQLLAQATPADSATMQVLVPLVYDELRSMASHFLRGDRSHTLQPTALVHEAFIKLVGNDREWSGKDHFKAVAAKAMRQILVDHYRGKHADKRGGENSNQVHRPTISADCMGVSRAKGFEIEELDEALSSLAQVSTRAAHIAEMRLFGGMEVERIARVMGVSEMTIKRDWQVARAWLAAKLHDQAGE